jgi:Cupin superfamily protein
VASLVTGRSSTERSQLDGTTLAGDSLSWLALCMGEPNEFLTDSWSKAARLHRGRRGKYQQVFSLGSLERLLEMGAVAVCRVAVIKDGVAVPQQRYSRLRTRSAGTADHIAEFRCVQQLLDNGYSLVLYDMQEISEGLYELCTGLHKELSHQVRTNVYYTPRQARGLNPHIDDHDVIILQVHGAKNWRIFDHRANVERPQNVPIAPGQIPSLEARLENGDALYIPRGFVHCAATADDPSVHVTVGIYATTTADLIRHVVDECLRSCELTDELDAGFASDPADLAGALASGMTSLVRHLTSSQARADSTVTELLEGFCRTRSPTWKLHT